MAILIKFRFVIISYDNLECSIRIMVLKVDSDPEPGESVQVVTGCHIQRSRIAASSVHNLYHVTCRCEIV